MTYEEKVRWLRRYQESLWREKELAEEVERLQSEATRITSLLSDIPGGYGNDQKLPQSVERIVQAKQDLQEQVDRCADVRCEIVSAIAQTSNYRDREILRRRYILGQTFEEIAMEVRLDCRWVRRVHKRLVDRIAILNRYKNE